MEKVNSHLQNLPQKSSQTPNHNKHFLFIVLLLLFSFLGVSAFLLYQNIQLKKQIAQVKIAPKPSPDLAKTPPITSVPKPTEPSMESSGYYYLEIRLKSPEAKPPEEKYYFLGEYLLYALGLPEREGLNFQEVISKIVYDTRKGSPYDKNVSKYNFNYYLALKEGQIDTSRVYEDEYTKIEVSQLDPKLKLYIDSSDYCEIDADCTIRTDYCNYGSFNYYQGFYDTWGCGAFPDETGYMFGIYDKKIGCFTQVEYKSSKCLRNTCVGQGREIYCDED